MTKLSDILSELDLELEIQLGYVRERQHPEFPQLTILNYTEKAQFERRWNAVTRITRGLIVNNATGEVLARPFAKMHNFDEPEAPNIAHDQLLFAASNKFDGSLGIYYVRPDGKSAIATRGSFESEQAIKGTAMLQADEDTRLVAAAWAAAGYTPLFEIVYPENRIVLSYDYEALVPLGYINVALGGYLPHASMAGQVRTMGEVLMDLSRPNAEGWVVWSSTYKGVKIKQADYVELHRLVTGLNRKSVWRALSAGYDVYEKMRNQLPDELYAWAEGVAKELMRAYAARVRQLDEAYVGVLESLEELKETRETTRKDLADIISKEVSQKDRGYMFLLADGRDIQEKAWRELEPVGNDK